jgi:predicted small metal-binding protein
MYIISVFNYFDNQHYLLKSIEYTELNALKDAIKQITPEEFLDDVKEHLNTLHTIQDLIESFIDAYSFVWTAVHTHNIISHIVKKY